MERSPNRFLASELDAFGRRTTAWVGTTDEPAHEVSAAFLQHRIAMRVQEALDRRGVRHDALARALGQSPEAVRKKLRGQIRAQLSDVLGWAMALGTDVLEPWPESASEFQPAELRTVLGAWEPGSLRLPALTVVDVTRLAWDGLAGAVGADLAGTVAPGGRHLIDAAVLRHHLVRQLLAVGVNAERMWIDQGTGAERADLILDAPPQATVAVVYLPPPATADIAAQAMRHVVEAVARLESAAGQRVLVIGAADRTAFGLLPRAFAGHAIPHAGQPYVIPSGALHQLLGKLSDAQVAGTLEVEGLVLGRSRRRRIELLVLRVDKCDRP